MLPPYSEQQLNWAFAAEDRGELPPGTALSWASRAKRREYGDTAQIEISEHPEGWKHSKASIKKIGELITEGGHDPLIRQVAVRITAHLPSKSPTQEIEAIYQWVRRNVRFRYDPTGMEWLQTASRTLKERAGDCDCLTILLGSLCQSIGHHVLTRTVGPSKHAPEHVSALVWDKKRWISCDPVLEGPGDTGSDRPGMFAAYAAGPSIIWDTKGEKMLGEYGLKPTAQQLSLWQFQPAFRQPTPDPTPDRRYSQAHTPGFGKCSRYLSDVGYYWLPDEIPGEIHEAFLSDVDGFGAWGFLKKLVKGVGKIAKGVVSSVVPGAGAIISAGEALLGPGGKGAAAAPGAAAAAPGAARAAAAATKAITQTPLEIKKLGQSAAEIQGELARMAQAQAATGTAIAYLPQISAAVQALPADVPAVSHKIDVLMKYIRAKDQATTKAKVKAIKKLRAAKSRKAQLTAMRKIARSEMSKAKIKNKRLQLAGLGLRPSFSFSFSGFGDIAEARFAAQEMVDRVALFITRVGKAPQVSLEQVKRFQIADGRLVTDGLYGPNAKRAAEWYLNKPAPPVSAAFNKTRVTWTPPAVAPTPPSPTPRPAPVIVPKPAPTPPAPTPLPVPVIIPKPEPSPAPIAAMLPTRAEIIRLEIASARGDRALLREMVKVSRAGKRRAKKVIHQAQKQGLHLDGKTGPTKPKAKDRSKVLWPVAVAVLALSR